MGDDNRKGFFNEAPNYGSQTYNEGPKQRTAPDSLASALSGIPSNLMIQVRVYGMAAEQRKLGRDIAEKLAQTTAKVIWFGDDHNTEEFDGICFDVGDDIPTQLIANVIAEQFENVDHKVHRRLIREFPGGVVRIGVGNQ